MKNNHDYPLYEVSPVASIKSLVDESAAAAPDHIAFKYKNAENKVVEIPYSAFKEDVYSLGTAITGAGFSGMHVACIGENSYNWVTVFFAMLGCTGVTVPIDRELPVADIINVINNSDSTVIFYDHSYEKAFLENLDKMPNIQVFIGFGRTEDAEYGTKKFLSFAKFLQEGRELYLKGDTSYAVQTSDPNKLKLLVYTSGTTGFAKGVMLTEHNLVSLVYYGLQVSTVYDTCLSVLPYHHTYESVCGLLVSVKMNATICINDKLRNVQKNMQLYKPSYIYLVPAFAEAFYKKIWSTAKEGKKDGALRKLIKISNGLRKTGIDLRRKLFATIHESFGGRLRKIVCGGAPIRPEIGEFFDSIGILLVNGYGITECSPLVSVNRDYFNDCSTTGVKLPCIEVKFENVNEDGNGEICVKGDTVMLGYYKNEEETAKVLKDGWFNTGDYGRFNEKKQLLITGRKKNLIVLSNGKNIYPEEIENYIVAIPYIIDVIVYSIKDETGESGLCAEVFLNADKLAEMNVTNPMESLKRDIGLACKGLPSYKQIKDIVIRDKEFEKTTSNKIKRNQAHAQPKNQA